MSEQQADILTIVEGCIQAHPAAQRALVNRCAPSMMSVARRYARNVSDAEDILQESFVLIFKNIHTFDPEKGQFPAWVRKVVIHAALGYYRKARYQQESYPENLPDSADTSEDVFSKISFDELIVHLNNLPESARQVFNLFVLDHFTHEEIGELLHIPVGTSRSLLSRARKQLQTDILKTQSDELARI